MSRDGDVEKGVGAGVVKKGMGRPRKFGLVSTRLGRGSQDSTIVHLSSVKILLS